MSEMKVLGYYYDEDMKQLKADDREGQEVGKVLLEVDGQFTLNAIWGTSDDSDYFVYSTGERDWNDEDITDTESISYYSEGVPILTIVSQADIAKANFNMDLFQKASRDNLSSFEDYLWKAISKADNANLDNLLKGFPAHVYAWKVYVNGVDKAIKYMAYNGYLIEGVM